MLGLLLPSRSDCKVEQQSSRAAEQQVNRCKKYMPVVMREARYFIGIDAPVHYFMGQIEQESRCNEGAIAFDGGMGLGQIMPETARELHQKYPELHEFDFNPYDPRWNIRAMILYDRACYRETVCKGWYFAFRAYNGGVGLLNREISRAGTCEISAVEEQCKRNIKKLKSGTVLDFCRINIEYPYKIFQKAEKWQR